MQPSSHSVTAIVVAHDGSRWLPETLDAVLRQTRPVDRVVGIDNGSRDGCAAILGESFGPGNVLKLPRSTGFGQAVAAALDRLSPAFDGPESGREWIWLIHDDCAPDRQALAALLWAADRDDKAVILGPKLRDWLDRRVLLEAGVTVDRSGRRDTGLEAREYDQGQHDDMRDVLAVSTAGMLIRRDVWERLGGLDPELPLFRDDVDLCWRAHTAGHRVLIVTEAIAYHAEAAARRRRRITVIDAHPHRLDRRHALFVIMANLPFLRLLWSLVRNTFASVLRTLVLLLAKQPANAFDEIAALCWVLGHPRRLMRARRARRRDRRRGYPAVERLLTPSSMAYRRFADMIQGYLAGGGPMDSAGRHHVMLSEPSADDGDELLTDVGMTQRVFGNPGVLLTLGLTIVSLVAARPLLTGDGLLGGGALVPVAGGAGDLWRLYVSADHATAGLGWDSWAAPYVAVMAGLSALCFGKTWLAVSVLLIGCVPLAGLSAYLATRSMISYAPARVWFAASYALLPVAMGTVAGGRVGTAVVLVLLPVYGVLLIRLLTARGPGRRRPAWGLGLLLAVGAAFVPLVYALMALLGVAAVGLYARRRRRAARSAAVSLAIALVLPIVLLLPWLVATIGTDPGRLLLEAGLHRASLVDARLGPESLLLLDPGGPGTPPYWATGGMFALAFIGAVMRSRRLIIAVAWGIAAFGVFLAVAVSRVEVGGVPVWPGVPLAVAALGLLVAGALPAHRISELRARGAFGTIAATVVALLAVASPLVTAGLWVRAGVTGPLRHDAADLVSAYSPANPREATGTLILRERDGVLTYTLLRGRMPLIGESDLPSRTDDRFGAAVAGLAAGRGGTDAQTLAAAGVEFVTVPGPVGAALRRALDSEPALARLSLSEAAGLWRMTIPVGAPPGPPGEGDVVHRAWLWTQAAIVLLALLLAAPGGRGREAAEERPGEPERGGRETGREPGRQMAGAR